MEQTQENSRYKKKAPLLSHETKNNLGLISEKGRIGRRLYFLFAIVLPFTAIGALSKIYEQITLSAGVTSLYLYWILALVGIAIFSIIIRLTVHRCHDFGASRWLALLAIIPFTPLIFVLIPGSAEDNSYGAKPKGPISIMKEYYWLSIIKLNNNLKY